MSNFLRFAFKTGIFDGTPYILRDEFGSILAAGSVDGTAATDGRNARTVLDTENKISTDGSYAVFSGGRASPDWGDPNLSYPRILTPAGTCVFVRFVTGSDIGKNFIIGLDKDKTGLNGQLILYFQSLGRIGIGTGAQPIGLYAASTDYTAIILARSVGSFLLIYGGVWNVPTLLYPRVNAYLQNDTRYPIISNKDSIFNVDYIKIPKNTSLAINPIASDSFNRADGAPGSTDGNGVNETGGAGIEWQSTAGTVEISGNKAMATSLASGKAIATININTANAIVESSVTVGTIGIGIVHRYQDDANYIYTLLTPTNVSVIKVVSGTKTTVATKAATISAAKRLILKSDRSMFLSWYNDINTVGNASHVSITDPSLGLPVVGLIFFDVDSSADNFAVWATGTEGQYV